MPWAPPALLTATMSYTSEWRVRLSRMWANMRKRRGQTAKNESERTEDVDVAGFLWYLEPQRGHLGPVCNVELHADDVPALLHAAGLVRGACSLCDFLELVRSARDEDQVRARLGHDGKGTRDRIAEIASRSSYYCHDG